MYVYNIFDIQYFYVKKSIKSSMCSPTNALLVARGSPRSWNLGLELHVEAFWCHQSAQAVNLWSTKCISGRKPSTSGLVLYI